MRIDADIGGTFTDVIMLVGNGTITPIKVLSTPEDFGRAFDCDAERVLQDVRDEKVSIKSVQLDYGVAVDTKTLTVDEAATTRLRGQMRTGVDTAHPPLFTQ